MILPSKISVEAIVGTTFDLTTTLYPAEYGNLVWKKPSLWSSTISYEINNAVVGSNSSAYKCLIANEGINPVGDETGHWSKLTPLNLENYEAEFNFGGVLTLYSKESKGITLGGSAGTVYIEAKPEQTEKFSVGDMKVALLMIHETKKYDYVNGKIKWKEQL